MSKRILFYKREGDTTVSQIESCCGIKEITSLDKDPAQTVAVVCRSLGFHRQFRGRVHNLFVFTDASDLRRGFRLAKYIKDNRLGKLTVSPGGFNPIHESTVRGWFWLVDIQNLKKFAKRVVWADPELSRDSQYHWG